jgi:hypothetical protein
MRVEPAKGSALDIPSALGRQRRQSPCLVGPASFWRAARAAILAFLCLGASLQADVLVRWDQAEIPSSISLGISRVVIAGGNRKAVESAASQGYDVYVEQPSGAEIRQLEAQATSPKTLAVDSRGKWPHIRSNVVTERNSVLQVTGRSAQPWIETNAALLRIMRAAPAGDAPLLTYRWRGQSPSGVEANPAPEDYLVAIAEAGSFGGNLLLPLDAPFQRNLLLGHPQARAAWSDIRRYIEFYSWDLPGRYRPLANIGVVTTEPMKWFEVLNLLARHNLPFDVIAPASLSSQGVRPFKLLVVLDPGSQADVLTEFERNGGIVITPKKVADPNAFALEVRQKLGRQHRVIDIWNGMTVVAAPYEAPDGDGVLVTAVNYSRQPLPVQLRVHGTFSLVHYESPEEPAALLPYEHREGYTEFVIPALRIGGRVFLSGREGGRK